MGPLSRDTDDTNRASRDTRTILGLAKMAGSETFQMFFVGPFKYWQPSCWANHVTDPQAAARPLPWISSIRSVNDAVNDLALTPTTSAAAMGLSKPQFRYRDHCTFTDRSCSHGHAS
jgi:hypothetical protein